MSPIGKLLREWRSARGFSQLDLAMRAGFSSRHLSFIETGRTQPSRQALLILAETLDVPLRERNRLLEAGGYAHVYRQTPLDADQMRHVRGVLQFILDRHEPYGAVVLDRYSNLLMGNAAATRMLGTLVDSTLLSSSPNLLRMVFHPLGGRRHIVNWNEVSRHLLARADRELSVPGDETAAALLRELREYAGPFDSLRSLRAGPSDSLRSLRAGPSDSLPSTRSARSGQAEPADVLLPVHIRKDGLDLRLFSAIMTLGTPQDVTLQELRIETFFPADAATEQLLRA
jgi:transcriptional regulator with XRE-family HTH domain